MRQQGQAAPPIANKKNYGDLPAVPGGADAARPRANSFDADDETRNFSSGTASTQQEALPGAAAPGPATRFSQMDHVVPPRNASGPPALSISTQLPLPQSVTGLRKASAPVPSTSGIGSESTDRNSTPPTRVDSSGGAGTSSNPPTSVSDTKAPSSDYQAHRDYSPSAMPPPLRAAGGPVPSPQSTEPPAARFPARKSSLGQSTAPDMSEIIRTSQDPASKPWTGGPSAPSGSVPTSPATQAKALPFIRPADIYKRRMEEEKERQSLDSSRPSMDSVRSSRTNENSESEGLGSTRRREESTDGPRSRSTLEPVKERKSEYGLEGYDFNDQNTTKPLQASVQPLSEKDRLEAISNRSQSTSPQLPNLNRMSGFGMDLFSKPKEAASEPPVAQEVKRISTSSVTTEGTPPKDNIPSEPPSNNFKTVVSQAFERKNDASLPATPTSQLNSAARTGSESAESIDASPIMSRAPNISAPNMPLSNPDGHPEPLAFSVPTGAIKTDKSVEPETPYQAYQPPPVTIDPSSKEVDHEPLQPPRPIIGRDESFRPHLPGGWNSYATTPGSEVPEISASEAQAPISSLQQVDPADSSPDIKDDDLTPTATGRPLAESVLPPADVGVTRSGSSRDGSPSSVSRVTTSTLDESDTNAGQPTPDLSMAPSGSLYSNTALDQRLLSETESESSQAHLRPDIAKRISNTDSDQGPTPLPKDTPVIVNETPGYFPKLNTTPKQNTTENTETGIKRSQSPDEENDRLHNEIVKNLNPTPKPIDPVQRSNSLTVESPDERSTNPARISSYLPSEYDNYWASTTDEETPTTVVTAPAPDVIQIPSQAHDSTPLVVTESPLPDHRELTPEPLSPRKHEPSASISSATHRYSWEKSEENVSTPATQKEGSLPTEQPPKDAYGSQAPIISQSVSIHSPSPRLAGNEALRSHPTTPTPETKPADFGRDAALVGGGLAMSGAAAAVYAHSSPAQPTSERSLSLADEKDPLAPPEDQHPSKAQLPYSQPAYNEPSIPSTDPAPSKAFAPSATPTLLPSSAQPPKSQPVSILPFKEIVSMPLPYQRIQKFDETRQTFATMESGLTSWISNLQTQHPEHAGATATFGRPTMDSTKFARSGGGPSPPLQQPYYQQYLNASSPTSPGTPLPRPGPSTPSGTQHGFSPAAGITTQQVQAKGKELLHTAGVFGGKAGKVGKGLLAKGKSKLRGGGNGDKVD